MGINVNLARSQARSLNNYVSTLRDVRNSLYNLKTSLNNGWQAQEMIYVNKAIDDINKEIARLSYNLDYLSDDIIRVAQEIRYEEERREAQIKAAQLNSI